MIFCTFIWFCCCAIAFAQLSAEQYNTVMTIYDKIGMMSLLKYVCI